MIFYARQDPHRNPLNRARSHPDRHPDACRDHALRERDSLRADFQHLRRWRKSVEQAQSYTFKAVITVIVAGFLGAVWLGVKVVLGK